MSGEVPRRFTAWRSLGYRALCGAMWAGRKVGLLCGGIGSMHRAWQVARPPIIVAHIACAVLDARA